MPPHCGNNGSKVVDSRPTDDGRAIRRRRECERCGFRFTTFERVEVTPPLLVIKKNGNREEFSREKLTKGIVRSAEKRPVSMNSITSLVDKIENKIRAAGDNEITSQQIGEYVMEELVNLDEISYIRFASVYRQFKDMSVFYEELKEIMERDRQNEKGGMIDLASKMTPNTPFLVVSDEVFENATEILNSLYGPIVGTSALGLYFQLKNLAVFQEQPNQIHTHFELQSLLNVSINQLETDRKMLEACGLLKTWLVNSKNQVMYLVRRPLSSKEFFATDLLTILLLEKLGDQVFQQVQNRMVPKQNIPEEAEEVTASVTDTFPLIVERMKRNQAQLTQVKNQLGDFQVGPQNTNQERPLDEKLLLSILENSFVELDSVKLAMEVIQTESALYGIDEVQMGKYVLKAVNLQTNRLDVKKLKTVISNDFRAPEKRDLQNTSVEETVKTDTGSNLTSQQIQITKFAGQMAPPPIFATN